MRHILAIAAIVLMGAGQQVHAQEPCATPEPLPLTVDGAAIIHNSYSRGRNNSTIEWTGLYVELDRPISMISKVPGEHCGEVLPVIMRPFVRTRIQTGMRLRVEVLSVENGGPSLMFRVVCILNGSDCPPFYPGP